MQLTEKIKKKVLARKYKKSKMVFYLKGMLNILTPDIYYRRKRPSLLDTLSHHDETYIRKRVAYYNKKNSPFSLGTDTLKLSDLSARKQSSYYFDLQEYLRYFSPELSFHREFGDVKKIPSHPTFVKNRPISEENENAILLKLNKIRHFNFINDQLSFREKSNRLVWRGKAGKPHRIEFIKEHFHNPLFDLGQSNTPEPGGDPARQKPFMSIAEQLRFKFILSIEGNDVATNLKWIMSSNSLCFMRRPRNETWYMEGTLLPDIHYVLLKDDYSDIESKMDYYIRNENAALEIIRQANDYTKQFQEKQRETLIGLLVIQQYFQQSGQDTLP